MLSSLLTDMCLDTINSTTKFSPVISRCNFAGVNGMSLHLQTEKLESITLSWQLSAARLLRCSSPGEPGLCPQILSCYRRTTPQPATGPPPRPSLLPPETLPPGAGGNGAAPPSHEPPAPGSAGSRCRPGPDPRRRRPPLAHSAPVPVSAGGRGRPAAPSRPSPAHGGQRRSPGRRRAGAGWKLTWG